MSDSGESDDAKRLSEADEIAEALRAGELDTETRFAERRGERADSSTEKSDGRTPHEILEDRRKDAESSADRTLVRAELDVWVPRSESGNLRSGVEDVLARALDPEIPSDSIHVRNITHVIPVGSDLRIRTEVSIEADAIVQRIFAESVSEGERGVSVELRP